VDVAAGFGLKVADQDLAGAAGGGGEGAGLGRTWKQGTLSRRKDKRRNSPRIVRIDADGFYPELIRVIRGKWLGGLRWNKIRLTCSHVHARA
jgi:hypothetical protein